MVRHVVVTNFVMVIAHLASYFVISNHSIIEIIILTVFRIMNRVERCGRHKIWDDANNAKIGRLVKNLKAPDRLFGSWLTLRGAVITCTVLVVTELRGFCTHIMILFPTLPTPPPPLKPKKSTADLFHFSIITDLSAAMERSSSHIIMNYVTSSSTLIDKPHPLTAYVVNP